MRGAGIPRRAARRGEAGMTLMEMLVVLAIIGVMAGAVSVGIGSVTRAPSVETEARRLATRLQSAADDAMLGDRIIAFTVERNGYGFATIGPNGAMVVRTDDALGFHRLPGGMVVTLSVKPPVVLGVDGSGKPLSAIIESGAQRWGVTYDGLTARAAPAPAA
ncbi:prepilin-type N-terminal cleavage/methylation domain-containing protein [Sphingomonas sp. M1-B02]|uniref:prepilin-type N-terminal cleavage/methylation domain-containing protein n=1 Tax=Sphingomonas sp. M1-B02 TaxID=3114300 RepID=UPI00223FC98C|nr:prepilin-type N-terminal cleavage/methylation domain-containing protein [Sphingomonas sp. S6-11]UZK67470.1 prepilin-type N-terminal cleavage/methylation domain-containing protein [Sphingomonas sp. S6-11]